jgi:hypothetical protein
MIFERAPMKHSGESNGHKIGAQWRKARIAETAAQFAAIAEIAHTTGNGNRRF